MGIIIGVWIGAIPIPLDWDRLWQIWPMSCVFGAAFFAFISLFISFILSLVSKQNKDHVL